MLKALFVTLLLTPLAFAQNATTTSDSPTRTITSTSYWTLYPSFTYTTLTTATATLTWTTTFIQSIEYIHTKCSTAEYLCPGCETTEFITLSTPCTRTPPGGGCPTDTFPPITRYCTGCPVYTCLPDRRKTHWVQTCTYPTGCPEPTKTARACPPPTDLY
ncbi:hypothetical protein BJ508DRAFT_414780 [Ascobolus immersus RN42]|uniref:TNFR-Cys domain-containing protein n=1 Tax=Ascobolus immersus RN42 TaxID=1160509 RepID=A0A3N4I5F8_ASCIM|nr:hypothetical protein BJ508DRAFT_414780 [Ascobolus immersus RN42]